MREGTGRRYESSESFRQMKVKKTRKTPQRMRSDIIIVLLLLILITLGAYWAIMYFTGRGEAGVRSYLSEVSAKQRELADAIDAYVDEYNKLPFGEEDKAPQLFHIPAGFKETFGHSDGKPFDPFQQGKQRFYFAKVKSRLWVLISPGPDRKMDVDLNLLGRWAQFDYPECFNEMGKSFYDPTNGIVSGGDMIRLIP